MAVGRISDIPIYEKLANAPEVAIQKLFFDF